MYLQIKDAGTFGKVGAEFHVENIKDDVVKMDDGSEARRASFSGWASTFGNEDRQEDIIERGAFSGLNERNSRGALKVKMFSAHDSRIVPGVWKTLRQDDNGLWAEGELLLNTQCGAEAYEQLKAGALDSMSVGFRIPKGGMWIDEDQDGRYIRHITQAELFEISLVAIPANPMATIEDVKEFDRDMSKRELELLLQNRLGMSRRDSKAFLEQGYAGLLLRSGDEQEAEATDSDAKRNEREAEAQARKVLAEQASLISMLRDLRVDFTSAPAVKGLIPHD